ncbi:AAA family ATPase [Spirosoma aerophilum]
MAKLTVRNVGPIREAELEVKKHTVFIGPQGSGKSTLAKLIAIGGDYEIIPYINPESGKTILEKYGIDSYLHNDSKFLLSTDSYVSGIDDKSQEVKIFFYSPGGGQEKLNDFTSKDFIDLEESINNVLSHSKIDSDKEKRKLVALISKLNEYKEERSDNAFKWVMKYNSVYIPAERSLIALLSGAIWSIAYAGVNLPKIFTSFARSYEQSRNRIQSFNIPLFEIRYQNLQGSDVILDSKNNMLHLAHSASGYQSTVPLLLLIEEQRQQSQRRFIIEEPELNLYPTAQKGLIYSLMGGLQPDIEYKDAEWVITTHSPYVLSSFNTLMLAYKVAQRSEELRAEVEKIIPSRCWINPDDFAAYYVDGGTVRSIISEKTGLIADNELDDVSEDLAGEQDQLFELSRSVPRA